MPADLLFASLASDFVELRESQALAIDLRYASANNFIGHDLYGEFNKAFLHKIAAEKLEKAIQALQKINSKYRLIVFDALRPQSVQYVLWDKVKGTDQEQYVANPAIGSVHSFGFAVDVSILNEAGQELDMGTPFDDFTPLAQPVLEEKFLTEGKLKDIHMRNRLLLRKVMQDATFIQLPLEWWHFDALPAAEVRAKYKIVE
ncbi:MAG: M15 family metallopeptidase [Pseudomonadota bacterium]